MKVAVIGTGYVGLSAGCCFAELGYQVNCHDANRDRLDALKRGKCPIYEPGLEMLMLKNLNEGRLMFSGRPEEAIAAADIVFIAVGTPTGPGGWADLSQVEGAARQIAPLLDRTTLVVIKSTVPAGTARSVADIIAKERGERIISVASNPEFLREGSAIEDFMDADRIVCGADDDVAAARLAKLYSPLTAKGVPFVRTSTVEAELSKYAANAMLALKIGFINDVADLCEGIGGDIAAVSRAVGLDRRIGAHFLQPGPGFGGSCFPKDTRALAAIGRRMGAEQGLIETLIVRNEDRKRRLAQKIIDHVSGLDNPRVAVLGTAFKAGTDDMREAAATTIVPLLRSSGLSVCCHDPKVKADGRSMLGDVEWAKTPYEAAHEADAVVVLTEWDAYRRLDLARLRGVMRGKALFDFRNIIQPAAAALNGFDYRGIGRLSIQARTPSTGHAAIGPSTRERAAAAPF